MLIDCETAGSAFTMRLPGDREVAPGSDIRLGFAPQDLHVFDGESGRRRDDLADAAGRHMAG